MVSSINSVYFASSTSLFRSYKIIQNFGLDEWPNWRFFALSMIFSNFCKDKLHHPLLSFKVNINTTVKSIVSQIAIKRNDIFRFFFFKEKLSLKLWIKWHFVFIKFVDAWHLVLKYIKIYKNLFFKKMKYYINVHSTCICTNLKDR